MLLLVETSRVYGGMSFGDLGHHLYGPQMRHLVLFSIAIAQMGFCCAYYIFVAHNLRDLTMLVSDCKWILPEWTFIVFQVAIYFPLSWIRKIKHFSITSLIADVFILVVRTLSKFRVLATFFMPISTNSRFEAQRITGFGSIRNLFLFS